MAFILFISSYHSIDYVGSRIELPYHCINIDIGPISDLKLVMNFAGNRVYTNQLMI